RADLWQTGVPLPLGALPVRDCVRLLETELGEPLGARDVQRVEEIWHVYAGLPRKFGQLGFSLGQAQVQGTVTQMPDLAELPMVVPRLVAKLSEPVRVTLRTLAAFAESWWSPLLLIAATGVSSVHHADMLVRAKLADRSGGEYRVGEDIAAQVAELSAD